MPRFALSNPHPCQIFFFPFDRILRSPFNYAVQAEHSESYLGQRSHIFHVFLREKLHPSIYRGNIVKKKKKEKRESV